MKPQICVYAARIARYSPFPAKSSPNSGFNGGWSRAFQRLVALAMALVLLPLAQVEVFAQQAPWPGSPQYGQYPQNGPYNGQYAPNQQPGYAQPGYAQPAYPQQQPYPQQPSPQQPYANQPYADAGPEYPQPGYEQAPPAAQPFTAEQLEEMLAPIALYPDALLAQVLAASTYPAQVASADQWLRSQGYASPDQVAAGADAQSWDPSVKALTAFPQVLAQMNHDLAWTTDLGNAYYNQPQDVLQTVQVLRQRAQAAGTLQNTPQEQMTYDQGNIELAPADPQVVYVPMYNPWDVYGAPVAPYPGFSLFGALESFAGSGPVRFGLGIAMAAFMHTPFGWMSWALDWLGNSILFNHSNYYSQSTTVSHWGSTRGGGTWAGRTTPAQGYNRAQPNQPRGGYGRSGNEYNGYNGRGGQGFAPQPDNYAGSRAYMGSGPAEGSSRGYPARPAYGTGYGNGYGNYVRPAPENYAYSRPPARPQQTYAPRAYTSGAGAAQSYARPGYGSSYYGQAYGSRPGSVHGSPQPGWRAPAAAPRSDFAQRGEFSQRAYSAPRSAPMRRGFEGYSAKSEHSGGFHLFGGGHGAEHSYGGGKAPKGFGGGKHSGGGGHSSSHGGWGHHH